MAFGTNYAERSRKTSIIMEAQIHMSWRGIHDDELNAAVRGWRHKKVAELEELLKAEYKTPNDQGNLCNPWVK